MFVMFCRCLKVLFFDNALLAIIMPYISFSVCVCLFVCVCVCLFVYLCVCLFVCVLMFLFYLKMNSL